MSRLIIALIVRLHEVYIDLRVLLAYNGVLAEAETIKAGLA